MKKIFFTLLVVAASIHLSAVTKNHHLISKLLKTVPFNNAYSTNNKVNQITTMPDLGTAANYALFTVTGAVGNTGISRITGDIGTNNGAITGFGTAIVVGATHNNDIVTAQCVTDLVAAYNQLSGYASTSAHGAIFGNGETLYTGVYTLGAAGSAAGVLTLDAQGDPNAVFVFKIGGAFATGAGTTVVLTNGTQASNIFWVVEGAISMAAATTMKGTMIANNAAVSMGAGGSLEGRMLSTTGAVAVYGDNIYLPGSDGLSWIGAFSTAWNVPANWLNGVVPTSTDQAFIGVSQTFNYFPNVPASLGTVNVGSILFGNMGGKASGVVVNTGSILNVLGAITYQSDAGSTLGYTCNLSGAGIINANSIAIFANTTLASNPYTQTFASAVNNLNIASDVKLTSTFVGADSFNSTLNITGGTTLVKGIIQTNNVTGGTSTLAVVPVIIATLQVANATPLAGLSATGTNIVNFKNTGATLDYSGTAQTIYTDAAITGLSAGVNYQNIKFSGTGLKTLPSGNLNITGDFTNILVNDANNNVSLISNVVNFNGTIQTLAGGAGNGTVFNNVTFGGAGTKSMASGSFHIAALGVLTLAGTSSSTILNAGGFLTLNSDSSGSASIAAIQAGPGIIGNMNVQRYFKAQATGTTADYTRNYRMLSSAVNNGTGNYGLSYLNANAGGLTGVVVAGPAGTSGGFTVANAAPTIYMYNESLPPSNASFTGGNFQGLADISTSTLKYFTGSGSATAATTLPVGNGFILYYIGNNINNVTSSTALNKQFLFGGSFIAPDASVTTAIGIPNQGAVAVKLWWNGSTTLSNGKTGYHLVGNPYAATIDWDQYSATLNTAGIYAPQVSATIYVFNYSNRNFGAYISGTPGGTGTNNAGRYIASGQGFFVIATTASGASVTFNETAKTTVQPNAYSPFLLLNSLNGPLANNQVLRLKLAKDAVNNDNIMLLFEPGSKNAYEPYHDADRRNGIGNVTTLASYGSNSNVLLAINRLHSIDVNTRIKLFVNVNTSVNVDTLSASGFDTLDPRFDVYLIDHYKKDSLMFSKYPRYLFNISNKDTSSFGANRFEIIFHKKSSFYYHLLNFTAKAISSGNLLTWKTENENDLTGFTLERSDGTANFITLSEMQSDGSGTYTYIDKTPLKGINYYRLMQNDAFDVISLSKTISVNKSNTNIAPDIFTLYPNPVIDKLNITINYNIPSKVTLRITNAAGRVLINRQTDGNNIQQAVNNMSPGIYLAEITDAGSKELIGTKKFIKK